MARFSGTPKDTSTKDLQAAYGSDEAALRAILADPKSADDHEYVSELLARMGGSTGPTPTPGPSGATPAATTTTAAAPTGAGGLPFRLAPGSAQTDDEAEFLGDVLGADNLFAQQVPGGTLTAGTTIQVYRDLKQYLNFLSNQLDAEDVQGASAAQSEEDMPVHTGGTTYANTFFTSFAGEDDPAVIERWQRALFNAGYYSSMGVTDWNDVVHGIAENDTKTAMTYALIDARDRGVPLVTSVVSLAKQRNAQGMGTQDVLNEDIESAYRQKLIAAYFDTWRQPPPTDTIDAAMKQGVNIYEFTWNERQKPSFASSPVAHEERNSIEGDLAGFFGLTGGAGGNI